MLRVNTIWFGLVWFVFDSHFLPFILSCINNSIARCLMVYGFESAYNSNVDILATAYSKRPQFCQTSVHKHLLIRPESYPSIWFIFYSLDFNLLKSEIVTAACVFPFFFFLLFCLVSFSSKSVLCKWLQHNAQWYSVDEIKLFDPWMFAMEFSDQSEIPA